MRQAFRFLTEVGSDFDNHRLNELNYLSKKLRAKEETPCRLLSLERMVQDSWIFFLCPQRLRIKSQRCAGLRT
jgi:hypothetical protein